MVRAENNNGMVDGKWQVLNQVPTLSYTPTRQYVLVALTTLLTSIRCQGVHAVQLVVGSGGVPLNCYLFCMG